MMEKSPSYRNYGYQREPYDQPFPSRKYNYHEQPYGQRIPSMQNSYKREPSDQRIPSRKNSYLDEHSDQRISTRQNSYLREPSDQRISTRQNSYLREPSEQRISSRQNSYLREPSDQHISSMQNSYLREPTDQRISSRKNSYLGERYDQRIPSRQNSYLGEPSDQRISSKEYKYKGHPYDQRFPSALNSYTEEPSEQRFPSRKNNYDEQPFDQRIPLRQYNYDGQLSDQRIPSRQNNYQEEYSGERIISRQNHDFDKVNQLISNQQQTPGQYLGPGQYEGPHVNYVPGQQVTIVPINGQTISQPGVQYMVKDTMTPTAVDSYGPMMLRCVYVSRVISVLCICLDICLGWIQVAVLNGSTSVPGWLNFLEIKSFPASVRWIQGLQRLKSAYTAFCAIATAYGLFKIVNMVGESLIEYYKQHQSENEPRFRGFQIIHGWVETVLGMVCDDIPQAILLLCFNIWCQMKVIVVARMVAWYFIKLLKTDGRIDSCKHHYKHKCKCECNQNVTKKCCVFSLNFCCKIYFFRPCASGEEKCCESQSYDIWPDFNCSRGGRCCGEIDHDPEWARNLYFKLARLFSVLFSVILMLQVLKHFTRVLDLS